METWGEGGGDGDMQQQQGVPHDKRSTAEEALQHSWGPATSTPSVPVPACSRWMSAVPEEFVGSTGSLRDGHSPFDDGFSSRPSSGGPRRSPWGATDFFARAGPSADTPLTVPAAAAAGERHHFRSHSPRRPQWSGDAASMMGDSGVLDDYSNDDDDDESGAHHHDNDDTDEFADELSFSDGGARDEETLSGDGVPSPAWCPIGEEDPLVQMSKYCEWIHPFSFIAMVALERACGRVARAGRCYAAVTHHSLLSPLPGSHTTPRLPPEQPLLAAT
jgi:hypothetical protein